MSYAGLRAWSVNRDGAVRIRSVTMSGSNRTRCEPGSTLAPAARSTSRALGVEEIHADLGRARAASRDGSTRARRPRRPRWAVAHPRLGPRPLLGGSALRACASRPPARRRRSPSPAAVSMSVTPVSPSWRLGRTIRASPTTRCMLAGHDGPQPSAASRVRAAQRPDVADERKDQEQEDDDKPGMDPAVLHPARQDPARVVGVGEDEVQQRARDEHGHPE